MLFLKAEKVIREYEKKGLKITLAESCTGGLVSKLLIDISGSSSVFDRGFITYSNDSKVELLDVPKEIIERHGAVSVETASFMAEGALQNSNADVAVSVTGIAGPNGGSKDKPVGVVYIGFASKAGNSFVEENVISGKREEIREKASEKVLSHLLGAVS